MQPGRISAGLTAAAGGAAVLLGGEQLGYLAPFRRVILIEHGAAIGVHAGPALASFAPAIYLVARTGGLADLGWRIDLAERPAQRGAPRARRLAPARSGRMRRGSGSEGVGRPGVSSGPVVRGCTAERESPVRSTGRCAGCERGPGAALR